MHRYYVFEALFILLGLALVATILKYPKDIFIRLPLGILGRVFGRLAGVILIPIGIICIPLLHLGRKRNWRVTKTLEKFFDYDVSKDDKPYPSTGNLKLDFTDGEKLIFVITAHKDLKKIISDLLDVLTENYSISEFKIVTRGQQAIVKFPDHINVYDYHLLVQHFNNELGNERSFGAFKSDKLNYFVFQDNETLNNLVGFTSDKKYFSVYMLDDLDEKQCLLLNQKLKIDVGWVEKYYYPEVFKI